VNTESFGTRLKCLRTRAGLTQAALAERAGVPLTTLRNWEHDRREPLVSTAGKLARALGVSLDLLVENSEADTKPTKQKKGGK
jgi:transcriptional regulator with XRE-family HTH domain